MKRQLQGIALILFGILLCMGSGELNGTVFHGVSYIPFSAIGVIFGVAGLVLTFGKYKDKSSEYNRI